MYFIGFESLPTKKKRMERVVIKVGDPTNAYVNNDEDKCIVFKIDSEKDKDYDQTKYNINIPDYSDYTDVKLT